MSGRRERKIKLIHTEYLRAYHELLKHEEVVDINIDFIFQTYLRTVAELRVRKDLLLPPTQKDIELLKDLVLDKLSECAEYIK